MRTSVVVLLLAAAVTSFAGEHNINWNGDWNEVTASREGLVGKRTATGHKIKEDDIFVALPHSKALYKWVVVYYKKKACICRVIDVGPWSIYDDYWNHDRDPLAEQGKRLPIEWGRARNPAAIDLSNGLWDWLEIPRGRGLVTVHWKFYEEME